MEDSDTRVDGGERERIRGRWKKLEDGGVHVHEERDGKLGTISKSSKALLDPRRGEANISSPRGRDKSYEDSLERNNTRSLNNILTITDNRSRITIPIRSGMVYHSLLGNMSIVVPC
jgi:hypothetical protein